MIKEICSALIEADVNVKLVANLRKSIKHAVNLKELSPGVNKKRLIQKVSSSLSFKDGRGANKIIRPSSTSW